MTLYDSFLESKVFIFHVKVTLKNEKKKDVRIYYYDKEMQINEIIEFENAQSKMINCVSGLL
jgi:hypothetical protein